MDAKILIVEDNQYKLEQIKQALRKGRSSHLIIENAFSFTSAWKKIKTGTFDLVILDISIPTFDKSDTDSGGYFRTFGGKELAQKMVKHQIESSILFITQYKNFSDKDNSYELEELRKELIEQFNKCLGVILYKNESSDWKKRLDLIAKEAID